ncbi:MAG: HIT domain-containing protein [Acidimicrobiia bacterium]
MTIERLWAAWRAAYVTGVGDVPNGEGSVFTRILASGMPDEQTHIVWRGTYCFAILNAFPYASGHVLVMPYREVANLEDLTPAEHTELFAGIRDCVVALKSAYRPEGMNVGANLGQAAGAGVPTHLHVHVLPRWLGDTNFMTSIAEMRVMPESLADGAAKIRAHWPAPRLAGGAANAPQSQS